MPCISVTNKRIYLSVPHMGGQELDFIREAFETNWLSSVGPHLDGFEQEMAARLGHGVHALAVSSGTAALHLVLRHIGVTRGDRVACSTLTFAGSAFPILYQGATPVFLDAETQSANLDPAIVREYLRDAATRGELPKALIAVHLCGQHADIDAIAAACDEYGVVLVEDAAESLGATYKGRETATTAPYSILSFNGNKIITTTGGGMVIAKDPAAIATMRKWSQQSREPAVEYVHAELGHNYRMSNVLAGIGRGQLRVLDERVRQRRRVAERYEQAFADVPGIALQGEAPWGTNSRWLTVAYLDRDAHGRTPLDVIQALEQVNIEARPMWRPMHTQPIFADAPRVGGAVAEDLYARGICLPSSSSLTEAEQDRVTDVVRSCLLRAAPARA
ncbi:DegT/DnrJ/EryC1/StrS family aminotransferase [Roseisolibacter agri]|uniref:Pyridoxal phosphate-dependent aminotransferase EpsN n=1 Tax=Roseisolibacter agri TaxID=2014610 RepID=A0AA37VFV2_9BACT|nr:DegT/DnrJ/EryC1/StrS family aminotransferase [Roseisolibacter agri]GLC27479.1 putative pyridoxal phosphate-dependent aminotransferase EpsN [Roseisolibacter agri]